MIRRASLTAASLLAVLGASACSPSTPEPAPESSAPPATSAPSAPEVQNPKNLKSINDACQLLTPEQVAQLGGGAPQGDTSVYGESQCAWANENFAATVAINTTVGGPAKIFEDPESSDNFTPTQVDGYPAARIDAQSVVCRVEVGIAEDQSVEINYSKFGGTDPEMQDPCGYAEKIASEVLKNIPNA